MTGTSAGRRPSSWRSVDSIGSLFSLGSIGSVGSIASVGCAGSILSVGSAGSILSIGSAGSILGVGRAGALGPGRTRPGVTAVARLLALAALASALGGR